MYERDSCVACNQLALLFCCPHVLACCLCAVIEDVLGTARRNELYASIYLMRSDTMIAVRNMVCAFVSFSRLFCACVFSPWFFFVFVDCVCVCVQAWRVWKAVVQNTSRMLNEVLPTLMNKIIYDLQPATT